QEPEDTRGHCAWRDPGPVLIGVRSKVIDEPNPNRDERKYHWPLQDQPCPLEWHAPSRALTELLREGGATKNQRERDDDEYGDAESETDRRQTNFPPRPALLNVVGAVERSDNGYEGCGTAPERAGHTECQQPAVFVVGESPHLLLNEVEN